MDLKSFESTSYSCRLPPASAAFWSPPDDPAVSHRSHPSSEAWEAAVWWGQRVEAADDLGALRVHLGHLERPGSDAPRK